MQNKGKQEGTGTAWTPSDWTIERVRRTGISPTVRNADEDYMAVATNFGSANRLARDCRRNG